MLGMDYNDLPDCIRHKLDTYETPFFLYNLDHITKKVERVRKAFDPERLLFAVKCNREPEILSHLHELGVGFEVNTTGELDAVVEAGASANEVVNSAPMKRHRDLGYQFQKGVREFAFDSADELDKIAELAPGSNVILRLYTTNEESSFPLNTRFGASSNMAKELLEYAKSRGLNPTGLTFHVGSQCSNIENWQDALLNCAQIFREVPYLDVLNIGGGIPILYGKHIPSIESIAHIVEETISSQFPGKPKILVEPGRYITGDTAIAVTSVEGVKKDSRGRNCAYLDLSIFNGLIELLQDGKEFGYTLTSPKERPTQSYNVYGASCDGTDIIRTDVELPELKRGDKITIHNCGAYSRTYGSNFQAMDIPKAYFIADGQLVSYADHVAKELLR